LRGNPVSGFWQWIIKGLGHWAFSLLVVSALTPAHWPVVNPIHKHAVLEQMQARKPRGNQPNQIQLAIGKLMEALMLVV